MENKLYEKHISKRFQVSDDGHGSWEVRTWIVLTEEVNRLIVWEVEYELEDERPTPIKTFPRYQRSDAIEFAVNAASEAIIAGINGASSEGDARK